MKYRHALLVLLMVICAVALGAFHHYFEVFGWSIHEVYRIDNSLDAESLGEAAAAAHDRAAA